MGSQSKGNSDSNFDAARITVALPGLTGSNIGFDITPLIGSMENRGLDGMILGQYKLPQNFYRTGSHVDGY